MNMKRSIVAGLCMAVLGLSAIAPAPAQTPNTAQRRQQEANRDRCRNGVVVGGLTGALVSGRGLGNKLGGTAIGATAGCIINKEWNRGK
jgi:predicted lipid-binding transport protein (Tim44 family)